jgi:hypothetical protein
MKEPFFEAIVPSMLHYDKERLVIEFDMAFDSE